MGQKIQQLQSMQQNLQNIVMHKQQVESQLIELNSALKEIFTTAQAYKIVGKIMIASSKDQLQQELEDQREVANIRLKSILKQEESFKHSIEDLQQEVVKELQEEKNEQ
ncbi:prefoldin subunit beta [Candidatus Woesearchaeota archaeon CG10_big_fil_rev_8_21_14_0_10_32_24]|nr:MAG: prefoldin subunit beta [Candidatus Woesearchaeota archaeon CG10_big_fil_rev_8_21_14_0_10_32_24]